MISGREFCRMLLSRLSSEGGAYIEMSSKDIENKFDDIVEAIVVDWKAAEEKGDIERSKTLLKLLNDIGHSPGTGQYDMFRTYLRSLQPGYLTFGNPTYEGASVGPISRKGSLGEENDDALLSEWGSLVERASRILVS